MQDYSDAAMHAIKHPIKEGLKANYRVTDVLIKLIAYGWSDKMKDLNTELQSIILPNREIHGVYFLGCYCDFEYTEGIDCSSGVRLRGHCDVVDVVFMDAFSSTYLACISRCALPQISEKVDDITIQPLCSNLGRFKCLRTIKAQTNSSHFTERGTRGMLDSLNVNSIVTEFTLAIYDKDEARRNVYGKKYCNITEEDVQTLQEFKDKWYLSPAIVKRNKDEPDLRRAEVASIKAVINICISSPVLD
jgi:hypothetical protein